MGWGWLGYFCCCCFWWQGSHWLVVLVVLSMQLQVVHLGLFLLVRLVIICWSCLLFGVFIGYDGGDDYSWVG